MRAVLQPPLLAACIATLLPVSGAFHVTGCIPGAADPSTYRTLDLTEFGGDLYYIEERNADSPIPGVTPVPGTGYLLADGTYLSYEGNGVPGYQRGEVGGPCFPGPSGLPCIFPAGDVVESIDEDCGHGPDAFIYGVWATP